MSVQRVIIDTTSSLITYPRLAPGGDLFLGVPSSAYVRVGTPSTSTPAEDAWEAATVDPMSATVQGAHDEGALHITVSASKSWIKGRQYLVDTDGVVFPVVCGKTATGVTLYLSHPLTRDVANAATISGWAITHALTANETDEAGPGIAMWKATVGGVEVWWSDSFRIVRRIAQVPMTPGELVVAYPQLLRMQDVSDTTLEGLIQTAWEYRVLPRLAAKQIRDEDIVDTEVLRPMVGLACLLHAVTQDESASQQWRESLQVEYDRLVEATLSRVDWYEHSQDDTPVPTLDAPAPRRTGITVHR